MIEPRTAKVLGALLTAMTAGALLLMLMESEPPSPFGTEAAAIRTTVAAPQWTITRPWRRIVVHSSMGGQDSLPARCHFIVRATADGSGQWVQPTGLWLDQQAGHHVYVSGMDFHSDAIGICIMGDFSQRSPDEKQFQAVTDLVRQLQKRCDIPSDSVYLQSELNPNSQRPGKAFPVGRFNASLL
jgi:hypothetical protein